MNFFKVISFLTVLSFIMGFESCNSHSGEINKMKKYLLWEENGKAGVWSDNYDYQFVDDIVLKAVETMTLKENGDFIEETMYYYKGNPLAKGTWTGEWEIEYDDNLDTYFFNQNYNENLEIQNLNMDEDWFKRFDTDLRLTRNGDAYDVVEDEEDEDKLYGIEIIDYNENLFLLKDLSSGNIYSYEPVRKLAKTKESFDNESSDYAEVGDEASDVSYTLRGKIGDYPIEMEVTAFEENIADARYRYLQTGSGEWIELEIDKDNLGRIIMYESLDGKKVGSFEGRFSVNGDKALYEGWHKNFDRNKELTFYVEELFQ